MDTYPRRFVLMSLFYLFTGVCVGLFRVFNFGAAPDIEFQHAHFNLLGFMTMMVAGVGYHVLPRFNSTTILFPSWVAPQFWSQNLGLALMISGFHLDALYGWGRAIFIPGAIIAAISVMMLSTNLFFTVLLANRRNKAQGLSPAPKNLPGSSALKTPLNKDKTPGRPGLSPGIKVADLVDQYPGTLDILVKHGGLSALATPGHIDKVREKGIPLETAIRIHGGDINQVMPILEEHINSLPLQSRKSGGIHKAMIIGEILKTHPATEAVFLKEFGEGCFSCPGQVTESLEEAARMHGVDPDKLVRDLNDAASSD